MRSVVRGYALLVIALAGGLAVTELIAVSGWTYDWAPLTGLALLAMYIVAVHFQFQVHSGWATDASTVPAVATALLLPPGIGMLVAGIGLLAYAVSRRRLRLKSGFHTASAMLAVGSAAHVASILGGPGLLTGGSGFTALPVAVLASMAYYLVSATTV